MLDGNVCYQHSVLSITFNQAVKLFSNLSTIPMAETITYGATVVAVPSGMQHQEHLKDFINIVYFYPKVVPNFLPESHG
jgi:hypothetical protein